MSQAREEIEKEYDAVCNPYIEIFETTLPHVDIFAEARWYINAIKPLRDKRDAALAALAAAERAAAEKGTP